MSDTVSMINRKIRHRGRLPQIFMVFGKFIRMFVYQSDWMVFPLSALIAGLVGYVIRADFMKTMEGSIKGAFAIACVAIWNGCFNSIQVICREREIIKREHRSGLHISSYVIAHMLLQAIICAGQTVIMLEVFWFVKIRFPAEGFMTNWFILDIGITAFMVTYAADMLALFISSIVKTTTAAMTVMPFILIFQLVFSGGMFSLPSWSKPLTKVTVSHYGLVCMTAQAGYNTLPMASAWTTLDKMRDTPIEGTVTLGEMLQLFGDENAQHSSLVRDFRDADIGDFTGRPVTIGDVIDFAAREPKLETSREKEYKASITIGEIIDIFGEAEVKQAVSDRSSIAGRNPAYERTAGNIAGCWAVLAGFALLYALLAMITLEFVDKDKR